MSCSYIKLPSYFSGSDYVNSSLRLEDITVIQSSQLTNDLQGSAFMEMHTLYYVNKGRSVIKHGAVSYNIGSQQMLLLNKAILVDYWKSADITGVFENMIFFLTDEFIAEFVKMVNLKALRISEPVLPSVKNVNDRLSLFFQSVGNYFKATNPNVEAGLLRLKLMELLYELTNADPNLLHQLLQIKQQVPGKMTQVMEDNFTKPIALHDFAYLSGRSITSFKRDFTKVYNTTPAEWLKRKRLGKAQDLLHTTSLTISDICYSAGFENTAHFSKVYKQFFGYTPSAGRRSII